MSYQVLARKYRPQKFSDVIGQEHVTRTLQNALAAGRIAHGYIFSGHRGIGKTTIARIVAMALNCRGKDGNATAPSIEPCGECDSCAEVRAGNAVDVLEIDAATNRGIDEIRELRDAARYRPARDRFKIWILDEAHQITDAAFNALLKTLEEPPAHVIFMMATTAPEDIPQTIRSRCQNFSFHAVKFDDIVGQLRAIIKAEKITADDDALALVAEAGDGSMRDALSIMDQAIACCGDKLTADVVRGLIGAVPSETLETILDAVSRNASDEVLRHIDRLVTEGQSPTHFARQLVKYLRNATVAKVAGADSPLLQISADERARVARTAILFTEEDLTRFLQIMLRTYGDVSYKQDQRFHLELGLLKLVHAQRLLPLEQILSGAALEAPAPSRSTAPASASRSSVPPASSSPAQSSAPFRRDAAPSPFEVDRGRKTTRTPEMSIAPEAVAPGPSLVVKGATAAVAEAMAEVAAEPAPRSITQSADELRDRVRAELEAAQCQSLLSMLEAGEWTLAGNQLTAKVSGTATMIEMTFTGEGKRVAIAAVNSAAGRTLKFQVVPGGSAPQADARPASRASSGPTGSARSRAAEDPIVRRMQEKFHGEIRTVIDHRDKKN